MGQTRLRNDYNIDTEALHSGPHRYEIVCLQIVNLMYDIIVAITGIFVAAFLKIDNNSGSIYSHFGDYAHAVARSILCINWMLIPILISIGASFSLIRRYKRLITPTSLRWEAILSILSWMAYVILPNIWQFTQVKELQYDGFMWVLATPAIVLWVVTDTIVGRAMKLDGAKKETLG